VWLVFSIPLKRHHDLQRWLKTGEPEEPAFVSVQYCSTLNGVARHPIGRNEGAITWTGGGKVGIIGWTVRGGCLAGPT
jgi:hypothetical protein